jgi:hypothetical protein
MDMIIISKLGGADQRRGYPAARGIFGDDLDTQIWPGYGKFLAG